ncbi:DEAD-domain-containing protein [Serendipita vermifera]|nr:DEAD-domain-containing protein [Serendipita vermifera]
MPIRQDSAEVTFRHLVDKGWISNRLLSGVPYEYCTEIQARTIKPILDGFDVLVHSKTGTGKNIAFLLPTIQRHLLDSDMRYDQPVILILTPTRESALHIQNEARRILTDSSLRVQSVVGGVNSNAETMRLDASCHLLVATPGRLLDHLENNNLAPKLAHVQCLVLDEADRFLDRAFRDDLERISTFLPKKKVVPRQTLFFTPVMNPEVTKAAKLYLGPGHKSISTVNPLDSSTLHYVNQQYMILDTEWHLPFLAKMILDSSRVTPNMKLVCFFSTAKAVALAAAALTKLGISVPICEIHSHKSQTARLKAIKDFSEARSAVLLSSDVVARGIDLRGITGVIQIGLPADVDQYVRRLGRFGGVGHPVMGLLLLAPWEQRFLADKNMIQLPIKEVNTRHEEIITGLVAWKDRVDYVMCQLDDKIRLRAYQAMLSYYLNKLKAMGLSVGSLVLLVNRYAKDTLRWQLEVQGKTGLPPIKKKVAKRMKLPRSVQGDLNLVEVHTLEKGADKISGSKK